MRDKVLGYGWPFLPQWSSNSRRRPRLFDWTDDPSAATVDTAVYMSGAIREGVGQPGRKVAWILESPSIARWQRTVPWIEQHLDEVVEAYEVILASDRDFCTLHPKIRYHPAGSNLPWIREARYGIYKKDRMCSMFASDKKMVEEHRYRREVAARLADRLDLFGGAAGSPRTGGNQRHPDKSEGLLRYRFQVVMENSRADFYYTEKVTDCFATGTVPIYWGSPSIGEICDTDGILTFNDDFDPRDLSEDLYYEMLPAVRRNLDAVKALESADDLLYRRYVATSRGLVIGGPISSEPVPSKTAPSEPAAVDSWDAERILASKRSPSAGTSEEALLRRIRKPRQRIDEARQVPSDRISTLPVRTEMVAPLTPEASRHHSDPLSPPHPSGSGGKSLASGPLGKGGGAPLPGRVRRVGGRGDGDEGPNWYPQLDTALLLHLPDAFIGDGVVFDDKRFYSLDRWWWRGRWFAYQETERVSHVDSAISLGAWGGEAFQHFILDVLPPLGAVLDLLERPEMSEVRIVSHLGGDAHFARWMWRRLGVIDRVIQKPMRLDEKRVIHANLVVAVQFEPNLNRLGLYPRHILRPVQKRLGLLEPTETDRVIYLHRGKRRSVMNQDELLDRLRRELAGSGLELEVRWGGDDWDRDAELFRRARLVLGPHGGAFANLIFAQPGTSVIEFVPRAAQLHHGNDGLGMFWGLSQAAGMDYWQIEPEGFDFDKPGMRIDIEQVILLVREILSDG